MKKEKNSLMLKQLQENWGWFFGFGIGLVILGMLAIAYSFTATIFSVVYFGIVLILLGIFEATQAFNLNKWSNSFLHIFLSILYIAGGSYMIYNPIVNAVTITLILAIFFVISGIIKMIFALLNHIVHRVWLFINGALTTALGVMIWYQWPVSGLWVLGLLVGIDILFTGWTWIMLGLLAKNINK